MLAAPRGSVVQDVLRSKSSRTASRPAVGAWAISACRASDAASSHRSGDIYGDDCVMNSHRLACDHRTSLARKSKNDDNDMTQRNCDFRRTSIPFCLLNLFSLKLFGSPPVLKQGKG
jgi:hypothetical protein